MKDCNDPTKMYPENENNAGGGGTSSNGFDSRDKQKQAAAAAAAASARARQKRLQTQLNERMAGFGIQQLSDAMHQQRGEDIPITFFLPPPPPPSPLSPFPPPFYLSLLVSAPTRISPTPTHMYVHSYVSPLIYTLTHIYPPLV